ncbi:hypothetical protein WG66_015002 [Moniliophthora roreri]|uniref:Uncharacterized protein n=1 Tax=Moniliophthora roreri TaxID=221103 RepID=A0A0W0FFJ4_MONRR|nr:hypothetical protein WG66_015002 [Moniliophthora roreri]
MPLALQPAHLQIDLSANNGPSDAKVVAVPLPAKTVGVVFGQRTAEWRQRYNTYLLDANNLVIDPQAVWDSQSSNARFFISQSVPSNAPDPNVLSIGPFNDDRKIAVYCSHLRDGSSDFQQSDPKHSFNNFTIGGKNAIAFTMINAEDGGDSDYHDTVVGVAVLSTTK